MSELASESSTQRVREALQPLLAQQQAHYRLYLKHQLAEVGVHLIDYARLNAPQQRWVNDYFQNAIFPVLTPLAVDPAHPFPWVLNKALCLALLLKGPGKGNERENLGVITVPRILPRIVTLPSGDSAKSFVFISDVVQHYAGELFKGTPIRECAPFRATRNSNLYLD